ncbi:MAG: MBL fold metallo-hydrolase [Deltaproteobacteria bacterium]|nr:MBL fold metallo-hydrolase [Deltaproteobacteria bacterium]
MKLLDNLYFYPWADLEENNCNSYYIDGRVRTLIDPGRLHLFAHLDQTMAADGQRIENVDLVIVTHAHPDHFEAVRNYLDQPTRVAMHREDEKFIQTQGAEFFREMGMETPQYKVDFFLQEGDLKLGEHNFKVFHTPGHSPGSICLYWEENKALFTGDLIFSQGVGRTDFPGCSGRLLKESILRLALLDIEYILPGHGEIVSGNYEVKRNFALIQQAYLPYV